MTMAEAQKSGGMEKDVVVYLCMLALAAMQFVIAYQNIDAIANVCAHADRCCRRSRAGAVVLHASCRRIADCCGLS